MSISKILLLTILTLTTSIDIILIGDSRMCGMAKYVLGFQWTKAGGSTPNIISEKARGQFGYSIKVIAEGSASHYTFLKEGSDVSNGVKKIVGSAKPGTKVLLWLGVNFLNSQGTFEYYKKIALQYKKLKFYAISVTGVVESVGIYKVKNENIKKFNIDLKNRIQSSNISNLRYKSILIKENPTQINNAGKSVNINASYASDGLHYNAALYKIIFKAMTSRLN